jgi:hypothetical protein
VTGALASILLLRARPAAEAPEPACAGPAPALGEAATH